MTINVEKVAEDRYLISATAPQWRGDEAWSSPAPLDAESAVNELMRRGFHIQDIWDAFTEEDPSWAERFKRSGGS